MPPLPSLRAGLLVHHLDDQTLVYDPAVDRVHLLDAATARVYKVLSISQPSRKEALAELALITDGQSIEALLALCIEELRKADLLDRSTAVGQAQPDITRRRLLNKIAVAGTTAFLVPAIATLAASAAGGQSTCIPINSPCTTAAQCCIGSNGARHCHHIGTDPPGNFCHDT